MSDINLTDTNNAKMRTTRHDCVFPVTRTISTAESMTQETVGGFTKLEQGAFLIAQGLVENESIDIDEVDTLAVDIANRIFDRLEKEK